MAAATLSPSPKQFFWNVTTGAPLANGLVYTVSAGGSYPGNAVATYQDSAALIPNANPIQLNGAGYATIYLKPGNTYKYLVYDANGLTSGTLQYAQDGIEADPTTTSGLDAVGTAGDTFALGQVGYLSDGTGGKTPGVFYLADSANTYSSTLPGVIAMATAAISIGATGVFRQGGIVAGLSGLTAGAKYYVGTAGALTATAPTNSRQVGVADNTTTQLDIAPTPALSAAVLVSPTITTSIITPASAGIGYGVCGGRLTLTAGTPVTVADVTGAATVYFSPYGPATGNIGLYDGSANWTILPFTEISIALGTISAGLPYDVFCYNNSGTPALRSPVAWTNTTTRATALVLQNGVLVKTGATTDRYLGTFYTSATTTTEDSAAKRYLWNYYNRVPRKLIKISATTSWVYTTGTWRQAEASTANQVENVIGVAENPVDLRVEATAVNGTSASMSVAIGVDSTSVPTAGNQLVGLALLGIGTGAGTASSHYVDTPAVGWHKYVWLEISVAAGTTTWYSNGSTTPGTLVYSGIVGSTVQ